MKLSIIIILMILFSGCSLQKEIAKSDQFGESIILERSGMFTLKEFGLQIYTLTQNNLKVEVFSYDGTLTKEINFSVHPGITYPVFEKFDTINFSSLDSQYLSTIPIADVGQGVFTYKDHSILIMPFISKGNPSEIDEIIASFNTLLSQINTTAVFVIDENFNDIETAVS